MKIIRIGWGGVRVDEADAGAGVFARREAELVAPVVVGRGCGGFGDHQCGCGGQLANDERAGGGVAPGGKAQCHGGAGRRRGGRVE